MTESCIVCLGDLLESRASAAPDAVADCPSEALENATSDEQAVPSHELLAVEEDPDAIAHLLPCKHNLHNECLKPWVERANSCPICRQNFNMVELRASLNGPCISSYAVQDKQQTAEIDASMIVDDALFDEPLGADACLVCEQLGHDEVLLLCDGCNAPCHTYCVGLDSVPSGEWFCPFCHEDGTIFRTTDTRVNRRSHRTRSEQRRTNRNSERSSSAWARVWQSVWDNLNIDLDFPFDDDSETASRSRGRSRELGEWEQRFRVAERQGGAARFRDTASTLIRARRRSPTPVANPESQEELRAWNAFEKAKELETNMSNRGSGRNKRKSATASPVEPASEPQRKLKRPRTRRVQDVSEHASSTVGEASRSAQQSGPASGSPDQTSRPRSDAHSGSPTFLQSLLKEVESSPRPPNLLLRNPQQESLSATNGLDYSSSGSPTSVSSPLASEHPSPRARSISPHSFNLSRPSSPPPLTSQIKPIFATRPEYSPASPRRKPPAESTSATEAQGSPEHKSRSHSHSHSRAQISYSTKTEIQKMVSAALKPTYQKQEIDTDEYTSINRQVSRMLYERIGDETSVNFGKERDKWQKVAAIEVGNALRKAKRAEHAAADDDDGHMAHNETAMATETATATATATATKSSA